MSWSCTSRKETIIHRRHCRPRPIGKRCVACHRAHDSAQHDFEFTTTVLALSWAESLPNVPLMVRSDSSLAASRLSSVPYVARPQCKEARISSLLNQTNTSLYLETRPSKYNGSAAALA